jgi:hypothetical protein
MDDSSQLELMTAEVDGETISLASEASKHSGRYIRERNPKLAQLIVESLRYGVPTDVIHKATGVHEVAIAEIGRAAENLSMEDHKRELLYGLRNVTLGSVRLLQQWIDGGELSPKQLQAVAVTLGITTEKLALLEGAPTHRIEVTETPAMKLIRRAIQAQGMVLESGNMPQTRGLPAVPPPTPAVIDLEPMTRDNKTLGNDT